MHKWKVINLSMPGNQDGLNSKMDRHASKVTASKVPEADPWKNFQGLGSQ